jgi:enamine deaminase RidA (YjgF/YER057c/UK114 family)
MLFTVLAIALLGQNVQHINPPGLAKSAAYTHVVTATGGRTVWISGQVALNAQGKLVGKGDLKAQLVQVYENLKAALAGAGATFKDVVKVNAYIRDYKPSMLADIREIRSRYTGTTDPPASTLVGVQSLFGEDFLVEVEMVAVIR